MTTEALTTSNVYQRIWDADQAANGVRPILSTDTTTPRDTKNGYVIVDWPEDKNGNRPDHKVLKEAVIPDKDETYAKCQALYNNYSLFNNEAEMVTEAESEEINTFIEAIKDKPPMKIAREYLDAEDLTDSEWKKFIREKWFTMFLKSKQRSGFEHVFVGEGKKNTSTDIGGYHFWHKYYVDDGSGKVSDKDTIDFGRVNFFEDDDDKNKEGQQVPEVVTLNFKWDPENDNNVLEKPQGGFWVGCSPEGLIALGMARWKSRSGSAVINGAQYNIVLRTFGSRRYINTFYPEFQRIVGGSDPVPEVVKENNGTTTSGVLIIGALVNPVGNDVGDESVTLMNISNTSVSLNGWSIVDKNNKASGLRMQLGVGEAQTVILSGAPGTAQLGNKGGSITLFDSNGNEINSVSYTKSQAKREGFPIMF